MRFFRTSGGLLTAAYLGVWLTLAGGTAFTLLLFFLSRSQLNTRFQAERIAEKLTKDLRENQEFTSNILDSISSTVAVLDARGIIIAVNKSWQDLAIKHGEPSAKVSHLGMSYLEVGLKSDEVPDGEVVAALKGLRTVVAGEQAHFTMEYDCSSPDEYRCFRMIASRLTGSKPGVVVIHIDVTELKRISALLLDQSELLRQEVDERRYAQNGAEKLFSHGYEGKAAGGA